MAQAVFFHRNRKALCLLILFAFAGCRTIAKTAIEVSSSKKGFSRTSKEKSIQPEEKKELNVAVVPFAEKRGNAKSYGSVYKYLIPLVPYGTIRYERPDQARMFNVQDELEFNMSENLLKITVDAVKKCGLFGSVIMTPTPLESKADLILSGDIYSTLYEGKTYSYGISFLGPALWCLGLPAGSSYKKLGISLYLRKLDTGEIVWSYNLNKDKIVIQGLYHNWGKNMNSFVGLMEEGIEEVIADLRLKLSGILLEKLKARPPEVPEAVIPKPETASVVTPKVEPPISNTTAVAEKVN